MKDKFEKWQKIREKGKWNYIIIYGVLLWGISTAILFSIIFPLIKGETSWLIFPLSLVIFPIGGMGWGCSMWLYMENAYKKSKTLSSM